MTCEKCGTRLKAAGIGRIPRFCSTRCRVATHRARRIPAELTTRRRWVRHRGKVPVTLAGRAASSTDPATWASFDSVRRSTVGDGVGFVLGDGVACIDLDHCLVYGKPNDLARSVLARTTGAYVEISPSGDGLHIWGTAPEQPGRMRDGIEVYSVGRYITITRNVYRPGGLVDLGAFFEEA